MILHLAHVTSSGGNSIDQIALAVGVLALGLAFLFQKNVKRSVSIALVAFGVLGIVAALTVLRPGFLGETVTINGDEYPEGELQDAAGGLCDSIAASDDLEEVRIIFLDRVHTALHVIAAGVEDDDRALSAELLRAKQVVEDHLSGRSDEEALEDDLRALLAVTEDALVALDVDPPSC